jgi:hypothetical protein
MVPMVSCQCCDVCYSQVVVLVQIVKRIYYKVFEMD